MDNRLEGEPTNDDDATPILTDDAFSVLARERRERAEQQAAIPKPDFVTDIEQTEVAYTFRPSALPPLAQVNLKDLADSLKASFKVKLEPIDFSPLLRKGLTMDQLAAMDEATRIDQLMSIAESRLRFTSGRFPLRNDFVPIRHISIDFERIYVSVGGHTGIAEAIAEDVFESLWRQVGTAKRWVDAQSKVVLVGYATGTRIVAPFSAELLLNPRLSKVLRDAFSSESRYVDTIGAFQPIGSGHGVLSAVATLDQLTIRVSKFDSRSGESYQSELVFNVTARSDHGTGQMLVTSELKYEDHVELLRGVIEALTQSQG